jgi:two-component system sensor histidine kinase VicK
MENIKDVLEKLAQYEKREKELELSEVRLKMAIEATGLGTWDYNPITGDLYWSDECKKIFGFPLDKSITFQQFVNHIHPDDKDKVQKDTEDIMDPAWDGKYDLKYRILRFDDNALRWVRGQGKVYFNTGQKADQFIGTIVDITDIKQAEEKGAKLAAIIESSDDAIVSKTLDSIITSWNDSAERMFGYKADEMIGQSILKIIPPDRQEEEPEILSRLRKGERVQHFETKRITKDHTLLDVSLTISPVKDSQGNIIGLSKIARDITEKKQEEQRKNDFIAMVSHELKTPLTSVKSYVQVLLERAKKDNDRFMITALSRADIQTRKMATMIHDFLSLARLQDGKISLRKEPFDLKELIEEVAGDSQFLTSNHSVELKDCRQVMVNADRDKITQVIMNLLSNAIKYSPNGGTITMGCEKKDEKVKIYVKDEGIGISLIDQKRLFERFYRVQNEKIKTVSGFGIGLYLVSEILRYHHSNIEVESKEGVGSTFYFLLPVFEMSVETTKTKSFDKEEKVR